MNISMLKKPGTQLKSWQDVVAYWNEWHKEWYKWADLHMPNKSAHILGWPIPSGHGGNQEEIWRYFPEPYWGNPCNANIIFININPGGGGAGQDLQSAKFLYPSLIYAIYNNKKGLYHDTIKEVLNYSAYNTNGWMQKKRVDWANKIFSNIKPPPPFKLDNILCLELIPWHTTGEAGVRNYLKNNCTTVLEELILNKVIIPALCLSQNAQGLQNQVIAKGSLLQELIDGGKLCGNGEINKFFGGSQRDADYYKTQKRKFSRWYINQMNDKAYSQTKLKVFVGRHGMGLPSKIEEFTNGTESFSTIKIIEI